MPTIGGWWESLGTDPSKESPTGIPLADCLDETVAIELSTVALVNEFEWLLRALGNGTALSVTTITAPKRMATVRKR